jgi:hypothetical protein
MRATLAHGTMVLLLTAPLLACSVDSSGVHTCTTTSCPAGYTCTVNGCAQVGPGGLGGGSGGTGGAAGTGGTAGKAGAGGAGGTTKTQTSSATQSGSSTQTVSATKTATSTPSSTSSDTGSVTRTTSTTQTGSGTGTGSPTSTGTGTGTASPTTTQTATATQTLPACNGTVKNRGTCAPANDQPCYNTCGPDKVGVKSCTCSSSTRLWDCPTCAFPTGRDYSCYKLSSPVTPCLGGPVTSGAICTAAACQACGGAGGYLDSTATPKDGYCVCSNVSATPKWSCASAKEWPTQ